MPTEKIRSADAGFDASTARDFDLDNPPLDFFQRPSPYFRALRNHDPIHRNRDGSVLLTRFKDVQEVWRDLSGTVEKKDYFRDRFGEGPLLEHFTTSMLFRDSPDHDRIRAILNPFFRRASLERLRGHVEQIVDSLLDDVAARGSIDFVTDFAFKLPTQAICLAIGIPVEDGAMVNGFGHKMLVALNQNAPAEAITNAHHATGEFRAYILDLVNALRRKPEIDGASDMLSALVASERRGDEISEAEIIHSAIVMFNGGHGTTMHLLAATLHHLLDMPDRLEDLRRNPEIIDVAIEEFIRFVTPVQMHWRRTTQPLQISSGVLPPQTEVVLCAGSANRDETVFEDPDSIILRREENPHIAFGSGVHYCIGRPLSRLEMSIALPRFLKRFPEIERLGPSSFRPLPKFRALDTLPIRLKQS